MHRPFTTLRDSVEISHIDFSYARQADLSVSSRFSSYGADGSSCRSDWLGKIDHEPHQSFLRCGCGGGICFDGKDIRD